MKWINMEHGQTGLSRLRARWLAFRGRGSAWRIQTERILGWIETYTRTRWFLFEEIGCRLCLRVGLVLCWWFGVHADLDPRKLVSVRWLFCPSSCF